jgi:hypothetical protein
MQGPAWNLELLGEFGARIRGSQPRGWVHEGWAAEASLEFGSIRIVLEPRSLGATLVLMCTGNKYWT